METVYEFLSKIELDLNSSQISNLEWCPSGSDVEFCGGEEAFNDLLKIYNEAEEKKLFKNIHIEFESCDCCDGHCSHSQYIVEVSVFIDKERHDFPVDDCGIEINKDGKTVMLPEKGITVFDFYRACQIVGIDLEFTDYAKEMTANLQPHS